MITFIERMSMRMNHDGVLVVGLGISTRLKPHWDILQVIDELVHNGFIYSRPVSEPFKRTCVQMVMNKLHTPMQQADDMNKITHDIVAQRVADIVSNLDSIDGLQDEENYAKGLTCKLTDTGLDAICKLTHCVKLMRNTNVWFVENNHKLGRTMTITDPDCVVIWAKPEWEERMVEYRNGLYSDPNRYMYFPMTNTAYSL